MRERLRTAIDRRDLSAIRTLVRELDLSSPVARTLLLLPEMIGRGDILRQARAAAPTSEAESAIERLLELDALLSPVHRAHIVYDLGEVRGFGYYTGMQFEVYVAGGRARGWVRGSLRQPARTVRHRSSGGRLRSGNRCPRGTSAGDGQVNRPLRIALPKGRMMTDAAGLWERIGSGIPPRTRESRRLILASIDGRFEFLPVKSQDVPTYVEAGVADAGVVGGDVLIERDPDVLRPLDLGFGGCSLCVAAPAGTPYPFLPGGSTPRVGTKYVRTARRFFGERGIGVDLVRVSGSVEIAPLLGLADWIVDLVQTGRTLAENGLVVLDHLADSTAQLIVNRASHKLRLTDHQRLLADLERALAEASAEPAEPRWRS